MSRNFTKLYLVFFFLIIFISSCVTSKKFLSNAEYDMAIDYAVKKLRKNYSHDKSVLIIEEAFIKANGIDNERIKLLELEQNDINSEEIFHIYNNMKRRQILVKTVYPFKSKSGVDINLEFVDFDEKMISAKKNAASYLYQKSKKLLSQYNFSLSNPVENDKSLAREAYNNLVRVKNYYPDFSDDIDSEIKEAKRKGTLYFFIEIKNNTKLILPKTFVKDLKKISLDGVSKKWKEYHINQDDNISYDYTIHLNITGINVSPEIQRERTYTESKEIQDGMEYVLDNNGNVLKDSLGNDIKKPKIKKIRCVVNEIYQKKSTVVTGSLEYINMYNNQVKFTDPVRYETIFEHKSAVCLGDKRALSKETKKICGTKIVPFPDNPNMIMMTTEGLKKLMKEIIIRNDGGLR